jgi:hypothetical protein
MKAWAWMAIVPIVGSLAHADSLGDAAKRERERREKKKATQTKVIGEEELVAGPGKEAKGTFSPTAGSASGGTKAVVTPPSPSSKREGGERPTEVDIRRAAARERLDASYETIRETAWSLMEALHQYGKCSEPMIPPRDCQALLVRVGKLALSVSAHMEDAEDAARQGWLTPGDVRDARQRHGMDDSFWDRLVRAVHQYRR